MSRASRARDYQAAQRGLTVVMLRDLRKLWARLDAHRLERTLPPWIRANHAAFDRYGRMSAGLASDYYDAERVFAKATGKFTVPFPEPPPLEQVDASLRWATKGLWTPESPDEPDAQDDDDEPPDEADVDEEPAETESGADRAAEKAARSGRDAPMAERERAAKQKTESVGTKLVTDVGRGAIVDAVQEDRQATAWARQVRPDACAFCKLLGLRGPVYKEHTVGFQAHNSCVPAGTLVDGPAAEVGYRRWYEGEMLVIGTAFGHKLSITPNHPVLTDAGWVPASLLSPGHYVLSSLHAQGSSLDLPNKENVPARIEDVWGALSVLGLVGVPVAAEDFHGDGSHGEVDVVRADSLLRDYGQVAGWAEVAAEVELALARVRESLLALAGAAKEFLRGDCSLTRRLMGGSCEFDAVLLAHLGQAVHLGFASAAHWGAGFDEYAPDCTSCDAVPLGEGEFALAASVCRGDFGRRQIGSVGSSFDVSLAQLSGQHGRRHSAGCSDLCRVLAAEVELDCLVEFGGRGAVRTRRFDPTVLYGSVDGPGTYARLGRDLGERLSGRVERDRVIEIRRTVFAGHVYNLQTAQGWYRADGIIVSNCQCVPQPLFKGQKWEPDDNVRQWQALYDKAKAERGDTLKNFRKAVAGAA